MVKKDSKFNIYFAYTYSKILCGIEVYVTASSELLNKLRDTAEEVTKYII